MRLDLVGNIKIMSPLRLKYFLAVLKSLECFKNNSGIYLNIENGKWIISPLRSYLKSLGFEKIYLSAEKGDYGNIYCSLINLCDSEYIMNIEDDHFCMVDNTEKLLRVISIAAQHKTEIIPATFFKLLTNTYNVLQPFYNDELCNIYTYNSDTFNNLDFTEDSIVVGNNCIFHRAFALRHWDMGYTSRRPHPFEELRRNLKEEHLRLMMPKFELLRPVDDDHGIENSCCIKNNDSRKWNQVFGNVKTAPYWLWKILRS